MSRIFVVGGLFQAYNWDVRSEINKSQGLRMSPRQKEFDPDVVLDKAMELFWRNGYEATSVQDLVDHLGVNRFSLYDTFGDKHALFMAACHRFELRMAERRINDLENADSGLQGIREFLGKIVGSDGDEESPRGCLMTNSVVERAVHDEEIRQWGQSFMRRLEDAFCKAITKARQAGEILATTNPRDVARYLTCLTQGINVISKASSDREGARRVIRTALSQLR